MSSLRKNKQVNVQKFNDWTDKKYSKQALRHNIEADLRHNLIKPHFNDDGNISEPSMRVCTAERQKIYQWLIRLKEYYGFLDLTSLLAIKLFDKFLALNESIPGEMMPLIAITCLELAVKMQENCILDFQ
jgi:hypothetical protein